jgi:hypothetical protein
MILNFELSRPPGILPHCDPMPPLAANSSSSSRRSRDEMDSNALQQGPRKKPFVLSSSTIVTHLTYHRKRSDPLVHSGRHFGRAVFGFCNVRALIIIGLSRLAEALDAASLTAKYEFTQLQGQASSHTDA